MTMRRDAGAGPRAEISGREEELQALETFLGRSGTSRTLVLSGAPGIGKTLLWERGVDDARDQGMSVLRSRPAEVEGAYSHAGLADLLEEVDEAAFARLPTPRRKALEIAVLRRDGDGSPPEPHAIAMALVDVLHGLASSAPVLVAIDDVQWLDGASAAGLAFAARRLDGHDVRFLLGQRAGEGSPVVVSLEARDFEQRRLRGLSLGAIRHLLVGRLGLTLPRRALRRLYDATDGNPLFALELGRAIVERGEVDLREDVTLPDNVEGLLGVRVASVPGPVREAVLAVALGADPDATRIEGLVGASTLKNAVDAGLLVIDGERVRPSHPLLAALVRVQAPVRDHRAMHDRLAATEPDAVRRARHRALAAAEPAPDLSREIAEASELASARGAVSDAGELADCALRLTPTGDPSRPTRVLRLAERLMQLGEATRATQLLTTELDSLPPGAPRARAHLILADSRFAEVHADVVAEHQIQAELEARDSPEVHAIATARLSRFLAVVRVTRIPEAEALAAEAWRSARDVGPEAEYEALFALGWARMLRGKPLDDLCARFASIAVDGLPLARSLERIAAERESCRGNVAVARRVLMDMLARAEAQDDVWAHGILRLQLCGLEIYAGELTAADQLVLDWEQSADGADTSAPEYDRMRAMLSYVRGAPDEAARWAVGAVVGSERRGAGWGHLCGVFVRGAAALCGHEPEAAARDLRWLWEHNQREGIHEPGAFPVAGDLVEALAWIGELHEADEVTARLTQLATAQEHPWALATVMRCSGLVSLARGADVEEARARVTQAARRYEALGARFDAARTLLALGRAERRLRKRAAARATLQRAAAAFDAIEAAGWAAQARAELDRFGGRLPDASGGLTRSEQRVVELAAAGMSNKEIAAVLVVSVHTVEVHLSHAYAKLGVRSRSQLAARLAPP
jgi:DNA-binding NarL/FixJ family response regulator